MEWEIADESGLQPVAAYLAGKLSRTPVVALQGDLGAGKTTLIKYICKELGIQDTVSSPTFSLVNEYQDPDGNRVFHFDFYRIESESEAYDMGYEEYFYSGEPCLIEWPERIQGILPETFRKVQVIQQPNGNRVIKTDIV